MERLAVKACFPKNKIVTNFIIDVGLKSLYQKAFDFRKRENPANSFALRDMFTLIIMCVQILMKHSF